MIALILLLLCAYAAKYAGRNGCMGPLVFVLEVIRLWCGNGWSWIFSLAAVVWANADDDASREEEAVAAGRIYRRVDPKWRRNVRCLVVGALLLSFRSVNVPLMVPGEIMQFELAMNQTLALSLSGCHARDAHVRMTVADVSEAFLENVMLVHNACCRGCWESMTDILKHSNMFEEALEKPAQSWYFSRWARDVASLVVDIGDGSQYIKPWAWLARSVYSRPWDEKELRIVGRLAQVARELGTENRPAESFGDAIASTAAVLQTYEEELRVYPEPSVPRVDASRCWRDAMLCVAAMVSRNPTLQQQACSAFRIHDMMDSKRVGFAGTLRYWNPWLGGDGPVPGQPRVLEILDELERMVRADEEAIQRLSSVWASAQRALRIRHREAPLDVGGIKWYTPYGPSPPQTIEVPVMVKASDLARRLDTAHKTYQKLQGSVERFST